MGYSHDYDKKLTRLINILTKLYSGDKLSVKELAEEFNVSERTIQRDFNERLLSFPIEKEGKKWKMKDGFKLEKTTSLEEQLILDIMEKFVDGIGKRFASKAKSLLSKIKNDNYNPIYTKLNLEDIEDKLDLIQELEQSIKLKKQISCEYKIEDTKSYLLTINPLKIANFEGFWYLIAIDIKDNTIKKYYLKNIYNIEVNEVSFDTSPKIEELLTNSISVWFNEFVEPYEVKIHVNNKVAKYVKRKPISPTQIIESIYQDGSIDIVLKITHEMEIIPIIKYWIPNMKIIEPKWINDIIVKDLTNYQKYLNFK